MFKTSIRKPEGNPPTPTPLCTLKTFIKYKRVNIIQTKWIFIKVFFSNINICNMRKVYTGLIIDLLPTIYIYWTNLKQLCNTLFYFLTPFSFDNLDFCSFLHNSICHNILSSFYLEFNFIVNMIVYFICLFSWRPPK